MLQITLLRRGIPEQVVELRQPATMRIGRGAGNDIILTDPDKTVSRTHGQVRRESVGWVFIDNDSQNGSWVDGRRMDRVVLRDGVSIGFGDYELVCEDVGTASGEQETGLGVSPPDADAADRTRAVPGDLGPVIGLGPTDQTRLASKIVASRPPTGTPRPQATPPVHDETRPQPPPRTGVVPAQPPPVPRPPVDLQAETIVVPADLGARLGGPPPAPPVSEELAETIVVPSDLSAQLAASAPAAAPPPPVSEELAETIVVPPDLSAQLAAAPPPPSRATRVPQPDEPTVMAPPYVPAPAPDAGETIVVPPGVAGTPRDVPAGATGTILAPSLQPPPAPSRPGLPPADDATIAVPVDAQALLRDIKEHEEREAARTGEQMTRLAPVPTPPPPAPAPPEPPRSTDEMPTLLMPGRPPTGQLAMPPRRSGEMPRPDVPPRPPTAPSIPAAPPSAYDTAPVFEPPAFEPPAFAPPQSPAPQWATPAPPSTWAGTARPPTAPPGPAPAPPSTAVTAAPWPTPPTGTAPVAVPPQPSIQAPAALPPQPPIPARPSSQPAAARVTGPPGPRSSPFRPAVLVWAVAWLVLFGLVGAGIWLWTSRGESTPQGEQAPVTDTPQPGAGPSQASAPTPPVDTSATPPPVTPPDATAAGAQPAVSGASQAPPGASSSGSAGTPSEITPAAPPPPVPPPSPPGSGASRPPATPPVQPVATVSGVPRLPDERPNDYRDRVAAIERQYNAGRQALAAGRAAEARDLLRAVTATAPAYKDAAELLQDADAAVRREGAAALATAEKQEQAGDYDQAIASYRRAERLGAPADRASAGVQRVQRAMTAAAEKAFADARQFDSLGRNADAARLYQVAVRWLPDGDPRKAQAQQRLAVLGTRRP